MHDPKIFPTTAFHGRLYETASAQSDENVVFDLARGVIPISELFADVGLQSYSRTLGIMSYSFQPGQPTEAWIITEEGFIDPYIHQRLCVDGVAVAILANRLVPDDVRKKRLVRVLPEWIPSALELYVIYPTRLSMTPKLNAFLEFMKGAVLTVRHH